MVKLGQNLFILNSNPIKFDQIWWNMSNVSNLTKIELRFTIWKNSLLFIATNNSSEIVSTIAAHIMLVKLTWGNKLG